MAMSNFYIINFCIPLFNSNDVTFQGKYPNLRDFLSGKVEYLEILVIVIPNQVGAKSIRLILSSLMSKNSGTAPKIKNELRFLRVR